MGDQGAECEKRGYLALRHGGLGSAKKSSEAMWALSEALRGAVFLLTSTAVLLYLPDITLHPNPHPRACGLLQTHPQSPLWLCSECAPMEVVVPALAGACTCSQCLPAAPCLPA